VDIAAEAATVERSLTIIWFSRGREGRCFAPDEALEISLLSREDAARAEGVRLRIFRCWRQTGADSFE